MGHTLPIPRNTLKGDYHASHSAGELRALAAGFLTVVVGGCFLGAIVLASSLIDLPRAGTPAIAGPAASPSLASSTAAGCDEQAWPYVSARCLSEANGQTVAPPDKLITLDEIPNHVRERVLGLGPVLVAKARIDK